MATARLTQFERVDVISDRGRILAGLAPDISASEFDDLILRTVSPEFDSVFVAAIDDADIAGIVCFMPHRLTWSTGDMVAYQAAGVLTSSRYRGRGIFPSIVRHFEEQISHTKSMLFGFPNEQAFPIWTKKLGYKTIACRKWKMPLGFGLSAFFVNRWATPPDAIYQNDQELIALKHRLYRNRLRHIEDLQGYLWGVDRVRFIRGVAVHEFALGGARFQNGAHFLALLSETTSDISLPKYLSATGAASAPLQSIFKKGKDSPLEYEVVIYKTFNCDMGEKALAFYTGVTDWF